MRAHFCALCGDALPTRGRIDRKYCRASCRTLAYRHRRQGQRGSRSGTGPSGRASDSRAAAVELILRLEQLVGTTQRELAVARHLLAQLDAAPPAIGVAQSRPVESSSASVGQPLREIQTLRADLEQLRAELGRWIAASALAGGGPTRHQASVSPPSSPDPPPSSQLPLPPQRSELPRPKLTPSGDVHQASTPSAPKVPERKT